MKLLRVNISPPHAALHCSLECCIVVFDIPMLARSTNIFFSICKYRGKGGQGHIFKSDNCFSLQIPLLQKKNNKKKILHGPHFLLSQNYLFPLLPREYMLENMKCFLQSLAFVLFIETRKRIVQVRVRKFKYIDFKLKKNWIFFLSKQFFCLMFSSLALTDF